MLLIFFQEETNVVDSLSARFITEGEVFINYVYKARALRAQKEKNHLKPYRSSDSVQVYRE